MTLPGRPDGTVPDAARLADIAAIESLAVAYAYAVDDGDWARWEALFEPHGFIDYRSAGGICGGLAVARGRRKLAGHARRTARKELFLHGFASGYGGRQGQSGGGVFRHQHRVGFCVR